MQNDFLQRQLDPYKLCANEQSFTLELSLSSLVRAQEALESSEGLIRFALNFSKNPQHVLEVRGQIQGEVILECQRCLNAMPYQLNSNFLWGLVATEEAAVNLPRTHEPVYLEDNQLSLLDALEDELILALPLVAYHPKDVCQLSEEFSTTPEEFTSAKQANPFSALQDLKQALKNK